MSAMRTELTENTTTTRKIADDTSFIREAWAEGVAVVRFGCRLAAAWRFVLRNVFVPVVLPLSAIWALMRLVHHETVPDFVTAAVKLVMAWM